MDRVLGGWRGLGRPLQRPRPPREPTPGRSLPAAPSRPGHVGPPHFPPQQKGPKLPHWRRLKGLPNILKGPEPLGFYCLACPWRPFTSSGGFIERFSSTKNHRQEPASQEAAQELVLLLPLTRGGTGPPRGLNRPHRPGQSEAATAPATQDQQEPRRVGTTRPPGTRRP